MPSAISFENIFAKIKLLMQQNKLLQSTFKMVDGDVIRFDINSNIIPFDMMVASSQEEIQELILDACKKFDIRSELPWRCRLIRLADGNGVFVTVMHHIIADLDAVNLFVNNVLNDVGMQDHVGDYAEFVSWSNSRLQNPEINQLINDYKILVYSNKILSGNSYTARYINSKEVNYVQNILKFSESDLHKAIKFAAKQGITLASFFMGLFNFVLVTMLNESDFNIGFPISLRGLFDAENIIGPYSNILLFKALPVGEYDFVMYLKKFATTYNLYSKYMEIPYWLLLKDGGSNNYGFDVMFSMLLDQIVYTNTQYSAIKRKGSLAPLHFIWGNLSQDLLLR